MTLLAILVCLGLDRWFDVQAILRRFDWFNCYIKCGQAILEKTPLKLPQIQYLAFLIPLPFIVVCVQWIVQGWFFNLFELLFDIAILLYCLGPQRLQGQLDDYFTAREQDNLDAAQSACEAVFGKGATKKPGEMTRFVTQHIAQYSHSSMFAVLLWFVIFGPWGAVLYRTADLLQRNAGSAKYDSQWAQFVANLLNWPSVRIFGLVFALVGHFGKAFGAWLQLLGTGLKQTQEFLNQITVAALGHDPGKFKDSIQENQAALAMMDRCLIVGVVLIALMTITAWVA